MYIITIYIFIVRVKRCMHEMLKEVFREITFNVDYADKSSSNNDASKLYGYMEMPNK